MLEGIGYNNSNQNFIISKVYREQGAASFEDELNEKMKQTSIMSATDVELMSDELYNSGDIGLEHKMILWSLSHRPKNETSTEFVEVDSLDIVGEINKQIMFHKGSAGEVGIFESLKKSVEQYIKKWPNRQ